jgi:hypothetical protein
MASLLAYTAGRGSVDITLRVMHPLAEREVYTTDTAFVCLNRTEYPLSGIESIGKMRRTA